MEKQNNQLHTLVVVMTRWDALAILALFAFTHGASMLEKDDAQAPTPLAHDMREVWAHCEF